ncbi:MAG TPA: hypothetical protein DD643_02840 [Synechococcus sp. UBA8638]|uniref:hypothetical protein n=1 Tax=Candidatus Synechococcus spongiarum TaxID=431041 RepID=UPI00046E6429|nr:hypothetical protein [Candidatus Synechococcus spongiarum]HBP53342.1 hypothetical protein [Synechococcus sp. UBA8638]
MTKQSPTRCQQAALLFAGVSCSILAFGSWSPEASAHPHIIPHTHGETASGQSTRPFANSALWLAGLGCAALAVPAVRYLKAQARSQG